MEGTTNQQFDYVIVGGGTAGSVIAARLAENPNLTICLIEAGPSDLDMPEVLTVKNWPNLLGTALDYDYTIEKQVRGNSLIRHSRGRVLGGCSSHNSCIAFRAPDADMDTWEQSGCEGWNASATSPYFEKVFSQVYMVFP
jgi:choline oxidase